MCLACVVVLANSRRDISSDDGIRIDVPADAHIRVENQLGDIAADIWDEKFVLVSAKIQRNEKSKNRSPVIIENRNQLLSISIIRSPIDPPARVELSVKIPRTAHADIISGAGPITVRGLPVSMSLRSASGDIRVELSRPLSVDIGVRSTNGVIRSELDAPLSGGGHVLQTRIGSGERALRISSDSGQVTLAWNNAEDVATREKRPPEPIGTETPPKRAGTPAPTSEMEEISEGDVIRVDAQLVTLNMSVVDRNTNHGVMGLGQADFRLFEDGVEQRIVQFDSASAPFDLVLLIDLSGSTRDVVKLIRAAALRFVNAARPFDRIGVITFAGQPLVVSPLTLDREVLRQRIGAIDTASGDTKLYDATDFAINKMASDVKGSRRTAIVLMSDGLDGTIPGVSGQQGSKLSYAELLNHIQEFDGVLYTLWLNTYYQALNPQDTQPEAFDMGHDRMKEMAEGGGGSFYEVERLEDLAGAYERVVADLGTVYSLAYRPSNKNRDGTWRAIRVNVNRPSAVARGKRGYYAN